MAVSKVELATGEVLVDLTVDTATEAAVFEGATFHGADGEVKTGTFTIAEEITEQDSLIEQIQSALAGKTAGGGTDGRFDALLDGSIIEIDSNVTEVLPYKCRDMTSLISVNLPECTTIGDSAFMMCSKIASFNAPKVTTLGTYCFRDNTSMTEYSFMLVEAVPNYAFFSCSALVKADFGVAKSIGDRSFNYCSKLEALILRKSDAIVTLTSTAFMGSGIAKGTGYIYVPAALADSYKVAENWSTYANQFRAIEDYPDVCGGAA